MSGDREQNLIQRVREKLPRFKDGGIVVESDEPLRFRLDRTPRRNPWTQELINMWRSLADDVEDVAENTNEDDTEEELHEIAAALHEIADAYEEDNG